MIYLSFYSKNERISKENSTAQKYTFYEILNSKNDADLDVQDLKQRCLMPGLYNIHLARWLNEFNSRQLFLVDFELFEKEPNFYSKNLQEFLGLKSLVDFESLKSNLESQYENFEKIDDDSLSYLQKFYVEPNRQLLNLLKNFNFNPPEWLN